MDSDQVAILTLPHTNDHAAIYRFTNNVHVIVILVFESLLLVSLVFLAFFIPYMVEEGEMPFSHPLSIKGLSNQTTLSPPTSKLPSSYIYIIFAHLIAYVIVSFIRWGLHFFHYRPLRIIGYHAHYSQSWKLNSVATWVFHRINGLILLITAALCHYLEDEGKIPVGTSITVKPVNLLQVIIPAMVTLILPFLLKLIKLEITFKRQGNPPDIFRENGHNSLQSLLSQLGSRPTDCLEHLLERQADHIHSLRQQNAHLRFMLFKVSKNRSEAGIASNSVSESDLPHD